MNLVLHCHKLVYIGHCKLVSLAARRKVLILLYYLAVMKMMRIKAMSSFIQVTVAGVLKPEDK